MKLTFAFDRPTWLQMVPALAGGLVLGVGCLVIAGWVADIQVLKSLAPYWVPMKLNTAVCFFLSGLSLWLLQADSASQSRRLAGRVPAFVVILVAGLTLGEYAWQVDFGLDQFLVRETPESAGRFVSGGMDWAPAANFLLVGLALLTLDWQTPRGWRPAFALVLPTALIGLFAFAGHLYEVKPLYAFSPFSSMAVHTALCFALLATGLLCARAGPGSLQVLTSEGTGGKLSRRLVPFAIGVPLTLGWLRLLGEQAGFYGSDFGLALFAVSNVVVFSVAIWLAAIWLNRSDAAQREAERRYRELIESLPQLVWTCRADGPCDYLSSKWVAYTGIPEAPQLGYGWLEQIHPDDQERTIARWKETAGAGLPFDIEFRIRRHDGVYRWFKTTAAPLRDAAGKIVKWFGTNTDITDQHLADQARATSEERLRTVIDNLSEGLVIATTNGQLVHWNAVSQAMFGFRTDHEVLRKLPEFVDTFELWTLDGRLLEVDEWPLSRVIAGERLHELELRLRRSGNDRMFILSFSGALVKDGGGNAHAFLSFNDITERREAEELLRASEQRFRFLADNMPQIIWTSKPDGNLDYYNRRWYDYTGMTFDQTKDWGWEPVLHPDDLQNCIDRWTKAFTTGGNYEVEYRFKRASDSTYRWHLGRAFPLRGANDEIIQWIGTCTDIDDQKRAETNLRRERDSLEQRVWDRTADLQRSNHDLEQFAHVASHDLQEPLRAVTGCAQILQRRYADKLDDAANELIGHVVEGAGRMQTLVLDLLSYSRVGTRQKEVALADSEASLRRALANLQTAIKEAGAAVTAGPLPPVSVDPAQLSQLFQNLVGNALKYRASRPTEIRVEARRHEQEWIFTVRDNGIGIESEFFERIFELFQRLHTRNEYPGTGIGLALCKKIVERYGGRIWVESTLGQGSVFYFTIPVGN